MPVIFNNKPRYIRSAARLSDKDLADIRRRAANGEPPVEIWKNYQFVAASTIRQVIMTRSRAGKVLEGKRRR